MLCLRKLFLLSAVAVAQLVPASSAEAGPLLDWLFHRNRCCRPACPPAVAPTMACQTTCQQTCSRVVVNYVPYTAYRCEWERVPVTTWQQTSSTDPCTGCTVTCNRPCTSYSWQMKQVPYTTYRPVYTTETYQVPVTYTSQVAAPVAAPMASPVVAPSACPTCTGYAPTPVYTAPAGTLPVATTAPWYPATTQVAPVTGSGTTEADQRPALESAPQNGGLPVIYDNSSTSTGSGYWPTQLPAQQQSAAPIRGIQDPTPDARWNQPNDAPQLLNPFNRTTSLPSIREWDYSPVRLASYVTPAATENREVAVTPSSGPGEYVGTISRSSSNESRAPRVNEGWRND